MSGHGTGAGYPQVSVVVVNHNYAHFVGEAIGSALSQSRAPMEVVVVDDGSTDDSRSVIARFGDRVISVYKQNGGQGSAFNAGFRHTSGSVVIFLDADDVLHPDTAARVVAAFEARPELAKVHYRLEVVDQKGRPTGTMTPPAGLRLPSGDLRDQVLRHPDDVPYPPSSGNAYARWALTNVLPMPEEDYRILADVYLLNLVPLLGPVAALEGTGGHYRIHDANLHHASRLRLERVRATVRTTHVTHGHMKRMAESLGLAPPPAPERDDRSLVFLSQRLVSRRLDPGRHPFPGDSLGRLAGRGASAALKRADLPLGLRALYIAWFLGMTTAPRGAVPWLAEQLLYPERRGALSALVERLRRPA